MYSAFGRDHLALSELSIARHAQEGGVTSKCTYTCKNQLDGNTN